MSVDRLRPPSQPAGSASSSSASAGTPEPESGARQAALGLGLAALGRPAYINLGHRDDLGTAREVSTLQARAHDMLDAAWTYGLRHVDAARSYGLAEQFLGSWLLEHPGRRDDLTIGSKWGYTYVADWRVDVDTHEVKDHGASTFQRQWPETLTALGTRPDLYLIHSVTPDSPALNDPALLDRLGKLAEDGVRVGLSTSGPGQVEVLEHALELADGPFSAVQATWNLLEPSAGTALAVAAARGWHVALKETVANGRLTSRATVPGAVAAVAARYDTTPDAVAVAAAQSLPVSVVLLGASTLAQLRSNVAAARVALSTADLATLESVAESPAKYWDHRSRLPWT